VSALLVRAAARQADALAGPSPSKPTFAGALLTSPWFDLSTASCSHWAAQAGSRHLWPCKGTSAQGSKIDAKDCSCSAWYRRALSVDMLVPAHLHRAAHWYTAGGAAANADHKLVSPARADAQETAAALRSQLATRAFVLAGGDEVLLPDIGEWVERVNAAGAQLSGAGSLAAGEESVVSLHTEPGAVHDYPVLLGRGTRRAADYLARCSGTWADL
jgi:acetyl esterase/lipase